MKRDRLVRSFAVLVAAVVVVLVCFWLATGVSSGMLAAIAIGTGVAVAVFSGPRRTCAPRFLRRREP
jgi:low temperature requirement protein LtrA